MNVGVEKSVNRNRWLLVFIFTLGIAVRLVLSNQDEASIGYDAWALLHYGVDRNGFPEEKGVPWRIS